MSKKLKKFILFFCIVYALLAFVGFSAYLINDNSSLRVLLAGTLAALPVPAYLLLLRVVDKKESEPLWLLSVALVWGCAICSTIAFALNTVLVKYIGQIALIFSGPLIEELIKGLGLFVILWWQRKHFNNILDGLIYASAIGLGFAMTENLIYYAQSLTEGLSIGLKTFWVRGILSGFLHPFFTSMTGLGIGIAISSNRFWIKNLAPWIGLLMAVVLHIAFNASEFLNFGGFQLLYYILYVPAILLFISYKLFLE